MLPGDRRGVPGLLSLEMGLWLAKRAGGCGDVHGLGAWVVVLGCEAASFGEGRGGQQGAISNLLSCQFIYIWIQLLCFHGVLGNRPFVLSRAWQRGLWVLFRFIFYIKDLVFIVKGA